MIGTPLYSHIAPDALRHPAHLCKDHHLCISWYFLYSTAWVALELFGYNAVQSVIDTCCPDSLRQLHAAEIRFTSRYLYIQLLQRKYNCVISHNILFTASEENRFLWCT
jgi:hypothetical protein